MKSKIARFLFGAVGSAIVLGFASLTVLALMQGGMALGALANLVIRANEIASTTGDKDIRFFAELLLNEVCKSLAARDQTRPFR